MSSFDTKEVARKVNNMHIVALTCTHAQMNLLNSLGLIFDTRKTGDQIPASVEITHD